MDEELAMQYQRGYIDGFMEGKATFEPCEDAISRQAVLGIVDSYSESQSNVEDVTQDIISDIVALQPVNPQPKTGHWKAKSFHELYCDNCGFDFDIMRNDFIDKMKYCPNCGCAMVEPQKGANE